MKQQLEELLIKLETYLALGSTDGKPIRQKLRTELKADTKSIKELLPFYNFEPIEFGK